MNGPPEMSCEEFDLDVDELAVGTLGEPERSRLLAHAAGCPGCEAELNWLAGLADRLLLLVPEVEPPAGFEAGVMARMEGRPPRPARAQMAPPDVAVGGGRGLGPRRVGRRIAVGRTSTNHGTSDVDAIVSHGDLWTVAGVDVGAAEIVNTPSPTSCSPSAIRCPGEC